MEVFRHLLLERLRAAERLSETFMRNLPSWVHPGFSVFAGTAVDSAAGVAALESQSRYITRHALALDALQKLDDGRLAMATPMNPRTPRVEALFQNQAGQWKTSGKDRNREIGATKVRHSVEIGNRSGRPPYGLIAFLIWGNRRLGGQL